MIRFLWAFSLIEFPGCLTTAHNTIILGNDKTIMDQILAIRPFVPAKDFDVSKRFYRELGFTLTHEDESVAILKLGSFSFILQNAYAKEFAENCMIQLLVRDVDLWWQKTKPGELTEQFSVKAPREPALQSWGMKVGFIFDPSGVLWHVAEVPF
jgi:hypothetical protein